MNKYNTYNINSIFLEPDSQTDKLVPSNFRHTSLFYCIWMSLFLLIGGIIKALIIAPFRYKIAGVSKYEFIFKNKIVFKLLSLNNRKSLESVIELVGCKKNNIQIINECKKYEAYPIVRMNLISLGKLFCFWSPFLKYNKADRRIISYFLYYYIQTPGIAWYYMSILKKVKPECVIMANDHMCDARILELVCEDYSIPCIYVQHASVSYAFPELHFSCSFLDGTDALNKYTCSGKNSRGNIVLLGASRYDQLSLYRTSRDCKKRNCIGIAINKMDDNGICNNVCNALLEVFPHIRIKIRAHPGMKNSPFSFDNKDRIQYTCASDESIVAYFDSIDVQISNDSGIHLDAILGGVRTIAFNFSRSEFGDNYDYLRNGLIGLADDLDHLIKFIDDENTYPVEADVVRKYDESYGKKYAGHCSNIIADYIISGCDESSLFEEKVVKKRATNSFVVYSFLE